MTPRDLLQINHRAAHVVAVDDVNADGYADLMIVTYKELKGPGELIPLSAELHLGSPSGVGEKATLRLILPPVLEKKAARK